MIDSRRMLAHLDELRALTADANGAQRKGGATQVRLWRDVLEKMAKEQRM